MSKNSEIEFSDKHKQYVRFLIFLLECHCNLSPILVSVKVQSILLLFNIFLFTCIYTRTTESCCILSSSSVGMLKIVNISYEGRRRSGPTGSL